MEVDEGSHLGAGVATGGEDGVDATTEGSRAATEASLADLVQFLDKALAR